MPKTQNPKLEPRVFLTEEKLRNADTDQQGHINNAMMASFFESGRIEVLARPELAESMKPATVVVVRVEIDYKKELFYPGTVQVSSRVTHVGRTSFRFEHSLRCGDDMIASGLATCVLMDRETRKPVPVPDAMRAFFETGA